MGTFDKILRGLSLPETDWVYGGVTLSGKSIPEDAQDFYLPLIADLKNILANKRDFIFNFKIDYYNTASSLFMTKIINTLEQASKFAKITVNWYYLPIDEQIYELGLDYKEISELQKFKIEFNLIERDDGP